MQTSTPDGESLVARVERLEKQYRWLNSEVVTEKIVLMDSDGKTRATLSVSEGVPALSLYDTKGSIKAAMRLAPDGPSLLLLGSGSKASLELRVNETGSRQSLIDANGQERLTLEVSRGPLDESDCGGWPCLLMHDTNGAATVVVASAGSSGSINLADAANSDTAIRLRIDGSGPRFVCLRDGKVLWSAP